MLKLPICFGRYQRGDKACDGSKTAGDPPCLVRDRCVAFGIHLEDGELDRGDVLLIDTRKEYSAILDPKILDELRRLIVKHRIRDGKTHHVQRGLVGSKKETKRGGGLFFKQLSATTGRRVMVQRMILAEAGDLFTIQRVGYIAVYGRPNHFDRVYVCAVYPGLRGRGLTVRIAAPFKGKISGAKNITGKDGRLCIEFSNCDSKRSLTAAKLIGLLIRKRVIDLGAG